MASADYTSHGAVAVITLNNPPVNALSAECAQRPSPTAWTGPRMPSRSPPWSSPGAGSTFCGGADVSEFGAPADARRAEPHGSLAI